MYSLARLATDVFQFNEQFHAMPNLNTSIHWRVGEYHIVGVMTHNQKTEHDINASGMERSSLRSKGQIEGGMKWMEYRHSGGIRPVSSKQCHSQVFKGTHENLETFQI